MAVTSSRYTKANGKPGSKNRRTPLSSLGQRCGATRIVSMARCISSAKRAANRWISLKVPGKCCVVLFVCVFVEYDRFTCHAKALRKSFAALLPTESSALFQNPDLRSAAKSPDPTLRLPLFHPRRRGSRSTNRQASHALLQKASAPFAAVPKLPSS